MMPVPWRYVSSWNCNACGLCCRGFNVALSFAEWLNIVKNYGVGFTSSGINKFYLKRRDNGSCVFLYNYHGKALCGLQHMKPLACKLWPFKVLQKPRYGRAKEAEYDFFGRKLYIYVDPSCTGLVWGSPTISFVEKTLTEFIELALGMREKQVYSTSQRLFYPVYLKLRRQTVRVV